jgi:hypothetical protein
VAAVAIELSRPTPTELRTSCALASAGAATPVASCRAVRHEFASDQWDRAYFCNGWKRSSGGPRRETIAMPRRQSSGRRAPRDRFRPDPSVRGLGSARLLLSSRPARTGLSQWRQSARPDLAVRRSLRACASAQKEGGQRRACDGRDAHRAGTNADCRSHDQAAMSAACPGRSSTAAPRLWPTEAEVTARWPRGRLCRSEEVSSRSLLALGFTR